MMYMIPEHKWQAKHCMFDRKNHLTFLQGQTLGDGGNLPNFPWKAGKTVAAIVRTTLGPRAMLKMLCGATFFFRRKVCTTESSASIFGSGGFLRIALRMLGF